MENRWFLIRRKFAFAAFSFALLFIGVGPAYLARAQSDSQTFENPAAYCAAFGTVDQPGKRYVGQKKPLWMFRALGINRAAESNADERLDWRCMNGRVLACFDGGASMHCAKVDVSTAPTSAMRNFCRTQPNQSMPMAVTGMTAYEWKCKGRSPQIGRRYQGIDARGYPDIYQDVTRSAPPDVKSKSVATAAQSDKSLDKAVRSLPSRVSNDIPSEMIGKWGGISNEFLNRWFVSAEIRAGKLGDVFGSTDYSVPQGETATPICAAIITLKSIDAGTVRAEEEITDKGALCPGNKFVTFEVRGDRLKVTLFRKDNNRQTMQLYLRKIE